MPNRRLLPLGSTLTIASASKRLARLSSSVVIGKSVAQGRVGWWEIVEGIVVSSRRRLEANKLGELGGREGPFPLFSSTGMLEHDSENYY